MESRVVLVGDLQSYATDFAEEKIFINKFLDLLKSERCYHRDHLPGHITGSAWIVSEDKSCVLLVHHNNLNRWLQPGGHADGDENVLNVATREVNEETGLINLTLSKKGIFDLDIHPIPARKGFPDHLHYDVRFLFEASMKDELKISEESSDLKWIHIEEIPALTQNNQSIMRMIKKLDTTLK